MATRSKGELVPGRSCGDCVACCTSLEITDVALNKRAGLPCPHCTASPGCAIYQSRPQVCRTFHCAWRSMPALDESWRPDLSGAMILQVSSPPGWRNSIAVLVMLIAPLHGIDVGRVAGLVTGLIAKGFATSVAIPRGPGFLMSHGFLNDLIARPVALREKARAEGLARMAIAQLIAERPQRDLS